MDREHPAEPVTAIETPGLHTWLVWRDNISQFATLLFQPH